MVTQIITQRDSCVTQPTLCQQEVLTTMDSTMAFEHGLSAWGTTWNHGDPTCPPGSPPLLPGDDQRAGPESRCVQRDTEISAFPKGFPFCAMEMVVVFLMEVVFPVVFFGFFFDLFTFVCKDCFSESISDFVVDD